ncbi:MAG: hypothetical protein IKH97_03075 [Bacteroidales bacterium]|nr:hypothetical protein [Bacteroidales bacterium]
MDFTTFIGIGRPSPAPHHRKWRYTANPTNLLLHHSHHQHQPEKQTLQPVIVGGNVSLPSWISTYCKHIIYKKL